MKPFRIFLFMLCAAIVAAAGYYNLIRIDNLEIRLRQIAGVSWIIIPFATRLFTAACFCLPVLVLFSAGKLRVVGRFLALLCVLIIAWDQWFTFHYPDQQVEMTQFSTGPWLPGIVSIGALALLLLLSRKVSYPQSSLKSKIVIGLVVGVSIALPFIINPVFPDNLEIEQQDMSSVDAASLLSKFTDEDEIGLYCFFTTGCPYCKKNCKKIYLTLNPALRKKVFILFPGEEEGARMFFEKTHTEFNYAAHADELFKEYQIHRWPSFMLVKNKQVIYSWTGNTFNYAVLHQLPEMLKPAAAH